MASPLGVVRCHQDEQALTFQVIGWGKMKQSLSVRQRAEQALASGVAKIRVDLRHCTYLDSTFLGTLLYLQRAARLRPDREFTLVCPSKECCSLLHQLGVEDFLPATKTDDLPAEAWTELAVDGDEPAEFNRNVLQAHQELANLGGKPGATFGEAARQLEQDMRKKMNP